MSEETEYISGYFPKSLVNKLKAIKDTTIQEAVLEDYIKSSKGIFRDSLEELEVGLKEYRIMMQKTVIETRKAREEITYAECQLWEKFDFERKDLKSKIEEIRKEFDPLKREIQSINDSLRCIDIWNAEKLINTIDRLSDSCSSENMNMFKFLIANYKKE